MIIGNNNTHMLLFFFNFTSGNGTIIPLSFKQYFRHLDHKVTKFF